MLLFQLSPMNRLLFLFGSIHLVWTLPSVESLSWAGGASDGCGVGGGPRLASSSSSWTPASTTGSSTHSLFLLQVCQNKNCCQRFQKTNAGTTPFSLVDMLHDLLPPTCPVAIESTGCLSQCDMGPNVQVCFHSDPSKPVLFFGIDSAPAAAAALESIGLNLDDGESSGWQIPSKLMAAVTVMNKARQARSGEEQDRLLSSVIRVLEMDDAFVNSSALLRAYSMRAEVRLDAYQWVDAVNDAWHVMDHARQSKTMQATSVTAASITTKSSSATTSRAFRVAADAYKAMGQVDAAKQTLLNWVAVEPTFQSKIAKELESLHVADHC